jgi:hypothetical protein
MPARTEAWVLRAAFIIAAGTVGVVALIAVGCSRKPLPEEGTASADLYVERCGGCHAAYHPQFLTARMWEAMVGRMEITMKRRGQPLSPADRQQILAYLARNAGTR